MIDLHCHLLAGLDDGAETLEQALQIAVQLETAGFKAVFATPHVMEGQHFLEASRILEETAHFQKELENRGIHLKVYPGGEHYLFPELAEWLQKGKLLTLGATGKFILVELPMLEIPRYAEQVFFDLQVQGITPIVAHPERYYQLSREPKLLYDWLEKGVLFQINLKSLTGHYGTKAHETALYMLQCGLAHFIGSDTHRSSSKAQPYLNELNELVNHVGESNVHALFHENPQAVLEGKAIVVQEENLRKWPEKKSWRERFFSSIRQKLSK